MSWSTGGIHELWPWALLLWVGRGEEPGFWTRPDLAKDDGQVERPPHFIHAPALTPTYTMVTFEQSAPPPLSPHNPFTLKGNSTSCDTVNSQGPRTWALNYQDLPQSSPVKAQRPPVGQEVLTQQVKKGWEMGTSSALLWTFQKNFPRTWIWYF